MGYYRPIRMEGQALARIDSRAGDRMTNDSNDEKPQSRWKILQNDFYGWCDKYRIPRKAALLWVGIFLLCIFIFILYGWNVSGGLSSKGADWGAFGSLLSGTFGMLASFTALATLFIVILQLRNQEEITEKQVQAIEFDRYDRHRRIFFERLDELERRYEGVIQFNGREELYSTIFPDNSPNNCQVVIPHTPEEGNKKAKGLAHIMGIYNEIVDWLRYPERIDDLSLTKIIEIQNALIFDMLGEASNGDVLEYNKKTVLNIYDLRTTINIIVDVLDSLLSYTGNERLDRGIFLSALSEFVKEGVLKISQFGGIRHLRIKKNNFLGVYEDMYLTLFDRKSRCILEGHQVALYRKVDVVLFTEEGRVKGITDKDDVKETLYIIGKVFLEDLDDEMREKIREWRSTLASLHTLLQL